MSMTLKKAALEIGDAQDELCRARELVELLFMAGAGINDRKVAGAITAQCETVDKIFADVRERLDGLRDRMAKAEGKEVKS